MSKKKRLLIYIICLMCGCQDVDNSSPNRVLSLSVSTSGRYVLSCHLNHELVLWDLLSRTAKRIAKNVNPFSLYFLDKSTSFIWQTLDNTVVYITKVTGERQFLIDPGFSVYGHVLSTDKGHYFASDKAFTVYHITSNRKRVIKPADNAPGYNDAGKWMDLTLSSDQKWLLSAAIGNKENDSTLKHNEKEALLADPGKPFQYSRWSGVMLWDATTGRASHQLGGNVFKTHAVISPDNRFVIAGDENSNVYIWSAKTGKRIKRLDSLFRGRRLDKCEDNTFCRWDKSVIIAKPAKLCDERVKSMCVSHERTSALRYLSNRVYLRFLEGIRYVILYNGRTHLPLKYLYLFGESPDVYGFFGGLRIVSSPLSHRLIMGSSQTEGILVYQYDEKSMRLNLIWSPGNYHKLIKQREA